MQTKFIISSWQQLSKEQLYTILRLRQEVFIVEQDCPYLDADGKDQKSNHVMMTSQGNLVGYARLLPLGVSYQNYCSIGRVILDPIARGSGQGYPLMEYAIQQCRMLWPNVPIKISAQEHLSRFYGKCGFTIVGESYLEDDIPHIGMVMEV